MSFVPSLILRAPKHRKIRQFKQLFELLRVLFKLGLRKILVVELVAALDFFVTFFINEKKLRRIKK